MNSSDFAASLHNRKCQNIARGFVASELNTGEILKGEVENATGYTKFQKAVHSNNIIEKVGEDRTFALQKAVEMDEDVFLKAVKDEALEVYDLGTLNKFKQDLTQLANAGRIGVGDIEKAKKDLGKLTKVQVSDKNGQKRTVWVKRGGDEAGGPEGKQKVAYQSDTKTKEEGDHIISRAKAALENPRTPMSMRSKAQEMIDAENKKWAKEHEAHSDYSNEAHPHHHAYKAGQEAAAGGAQSHAYDKNSETGKAKSEAWEAGYKSAGGGKKPDYDKELETMYDKNTGGGKKEGAPEEKKPVEKPKEDKAEVAAKKNIHPKAKDMDEHIANKGKPNKVMKVPNKEGKPEHKAVFSHREYVAQMAEHHGDKELAKHIREKSPRKSLSAHESGLAIAHEEKKKAEDIVSKYNPDGSEKNPNDGISPNPDDKHGEARKNAEPGKKDQAEMESILDKKDAKIEVKRVNGDRIVYVNGETALNLESKDWNSEKLKTALERAYNASKTKAKEIADKYNPDGSEKKATKTPITKTLKNSRPKDAWPAEKKSLDEHISDKKGWERNAEYDMDAKHVGGGIHAFKTDDGDIVYISNPGKANEKEHDEDEAKAAFEKHQGKVEKAMEEEEIFEQ